MGRKRREYTYEEYMKAMDLHNKYKYGYRRISRILGISQYTIRSWLHYGVIPPAAKWVAKPSIELAYVIGTVHGDGCVYKDESRSKYVIRLAVVDKEFAIVFSRAMSRLLNRKYIEPWWNEKDKVWRVKYQS